MVQKRTLNYIDSDSFMLPLERTSSHALFQPKNYNYDMLTTLARYFLPAGTLRRLVRETNACRNLHASSTQQKGTCGSPGQRMLHTNQRRA
jgi:hypothetical protein